MHLLKQGDIYYTIKIKSWLRKEMFNPFRFRTIFWQLATATDENNLLHDLKQFSMLRPLKS